MEISFLRCLEVVADKEDHKRERVFNMQLRLLSKKYTKEKRARSLLTEIESAQFVMVREVKMEQMQPVLHAEEEVW